MRGAWRFYWATQLVNINGWVFFSLEEPAYRVDHQAFGKGSYLSVLYQKRGATTTLPTHTATVITEWHKATKMTGWEAKYTEQTPLWEGDFLLKVTHLKGFRSWSNIGIDLLGDVWKKGKLLEFSELQAEYQMGGGEFLHYSQFKHAIHHHLHTGDQLPEYTPLEDRLLLDPMIDKAISLTYKKLINNTPDTLGQLREMWESDIGLLEEDDWVEALQCPREIAVKARFHLIQLKILHRAYIPRTVQYHIGYSASEYCVRGCGDVGTFFHILWDCPKIQDYWQRISEIMSEVVGLGVRKETRWHILGVTGDITWPKQCKTWLALASVIAKRNIARLWGANAAPTMKDWEKDLDRCQRAEQVVYQSRGCPQKWEKIWTAWRLYRGDLTDA